MTDEDSVQKERILRGVVRDGKKGCMGTSPEGPPWVKALGE